MTDNPTQTRQPLDITAEPDPTRTINQKETTMTTTTNPYKLPAAIFGWALIATVLGGLWGAGHNPDNAGISAAAIVASVGIYLYYKARSVSWARKATRAAVAR